MYFPVSGWFAAFVLTLAIEAPIVWLLLRRAEPDPLRIGLLIAFANLATHPAVWFIVPQLLLIGTLAYTVGAEIWAVAAEAVFYWAVVASACVGPSLSPSPPIPLRSSPVG
jgi:hypothetical protein